MATLETDSQGYAYVGEDNGSGRVIVPTKSGDGDHATIGAKSDAAATNATSSWSLVSLLKGIYAKLAGTLTVTGSVGVTNVSQPLVVAPAMTYAGKTAGQTFDVPHVAKQRVAATFDSPTAFTGEIGTSSYAQLASQDGTAYTRGDTTNTFYGQHLFSFDLLNDLKARNLIPKSWTATELKAALKSITVTWVGYGVGSNGGGSTNGATVKAWRDSTAAYVSLGTNTASSPSSVAAGVSVSGNYLDANCILHILAHSTYPSDGTIASTIYTDFVKVDVTFQAEYLLTPDVETMGRPGQVAPSKAVQVGGKDSSGNLRELGVSTTAADGQALAQNRALVSAVQMASNGATLDMVRVPTVFKYATQNFAAPGVMTVWTPASGKKHRLMGLLVTVNGATLITFKDGASGTAVATVQFAAAGSLFVDFKQGRISGAANNILEAQVVSGAPLVNVTTYGTEE